MKTKLIRIGNSRGIRIPKALIEQCRFEKIVELTVDGGRLIVTSAPQSREGWEEAFRLMSESGDDVLLDPPVLDSLFDSQEWDW